MNIFDVFKNKIGSELNNGEQIANEKIIELATFFYKIDKRISLEEQQFITDLMDSVEWDSTISVEVYQSECISRVNAIVGKTEEEVFEYLAGIMEVLASNSAVERAKAIAKEISDSDGEIADEEVKYLDYVSSYA